MTERTYVTYTLDDGDEITIVLRYSDPTPWELSGQLGEEMKYTNISVSNKRPISPSAPTRKQLEDLSGWFYEMYPQYLEAK